MEPYIPSHAPERRCSGQVAAGIRSVAAETVSRQTIVVIAPGCRGAPKLWRSLRERRLWRVDLAAAATVPRVAYCSIVLGVQTSPACWFLLPPAASCFNTSLPGARSTGSERTPLQVWRHSSSCTRIEWWSA